MQNARFEETRASIQATARFQTLEDGKQARVPVDDIRDDQNIRVVEHNDDFRQLVASIQQSGVLQPITITHLGDGIVCVSGHRRLAACRQLGIKRIPAIFRRFVDEEREILLAQLSENLTRADMRPLDVANAFYKLKQLGYKQAELERLFDRKRQTISRYQRMATWPPEAKQIVVNNPDKFTTAKLFALATRRIGDDELVQRLQEMVVGGEGKEKKAKPTLPRTVKAWQKRVDGYLAKKSLTPSQKKVLNEFLSDMGIEI